MFNVRIILTRIACALVAFNFLNTRFLQAAVPESVAIRKQPAEVEKILAAFEAKSNGAVGQWLTTTSAGTQNRDWITGIASPGMWYWRAASADSAAVSMLYQDQDFWLLIPPGTKTSGAFHFQYDTLRNGFPVGSDVGAQNYLMDSYLFHMNLFPRQYIGALGGLSIIGTETLDGASVIHLHTDPRKDTLVRTDKALNIESAAAAKSVLDLYVDPQKNAVVKLVIAGVGPEIESEVTNWDSFGTGQSWPSKIVSKPTTSKAATTAVTTRPSPKMATLVITQFVSGPDKQFAAVQQQFDSNELFLTPTTSIRSAAFQKQEVAINATAYNRAALAWASFSENDVAGGLAQWKLLDAGNLSADAKLRLLNWLLSPASMSLFMASGDARQQPACLELMARFTDSLTDEQFLLVSTGMEGAWKKLIVDPSVRTSFAPISQRMIPRIARLCSVYHLEQIIRLANQNADVAKLVNPPFEAVFSNTIPPTGLAESRQDFMLVAAIRAEDLPRAEAYVNAFKWEADAKTEYVRMGQNWKDAFVSYHLLAQGQDQQLPLAIAQYGVFTSNKEDAADFVYGRKLITIAVSDLLLARLSDAGKMQPAALMRTTQTCPGAAGFWQEQIVACAQRVLLKPDALNSIAPLFGVVAQDFGLPHFEYTAWLQLASDQQLQEKGIEVSVRCIDSALAKAATDSERLRAISFLARTYAGAKEYTAGAKAVELAGKMVHDESVSKSITNIIRSLKEKADTVPAAGASNPVASPSPTQNGQLQN